MATPGLSFPAGSIVPNPCGEAETNRNWDAVRRVITNIVNNINNYGSGTRIAEVGLVDDVSACVPAVVSISAGSFRPLFLDDPANPMIVPETCLNYRMFAVANGPKAYIAYDPNENKWEIIEVDHALITAIVNAGKIPGAVRFITNVFTAPQCGGSGVIDLETTTARAIYNQGVNSSGGCTIYSNEVEMEVWSKTLDPTNYTEYTFDSLQVLTDVYQTTAYGNIMGYYYRVYAPCIQLVGEDLLIYVDTCPP